MTKQDQNVETGGQAIQAARDVIITKNAAMSAKQMMEIMAAMAKQLAAFTEEANRTMDERLHSFRDEVLKRFANQETSNSEAFKDPDFQFVLRDAQEAYARSGDDAVRDTLVDIIARRSMETKHDRLAMALNDAARKAPSLTKNEFAELSLCYILRYTKTNTVISFQSFLANVASQIMPFVPDISEEAASYWHLESQGCAKIEVGEIQIIEIFRRVYGGVLGKGFDRKQLEDHLGADRRSALDGNNDQGIPWIIPCVNDNAKFQPNALDRQQFIDRTKATGLGEERLNNVWNLFENTIFSENELIERMSVIPNVTELFSKWKNTPLKRLSLNTVGMAIAHANAVRVINFGAPLTIWIK